MRRGLKIGLAALAALAVLIAITAVITEKETKSAEVNVPGGRILQLNGGAMQVLDKGPRNGSPIVLIHCFTCAMDWWFGMMPQLERDHRVVVVDLLGHGGSEKPSSGYTIPNQADLVAQALGRLGVREATVVGHSLGGSIAVALAEESPKLVERLVIIDTPPTAEGSDLGPVAKLGFAPVVGPALWRIKPDFAVRDGLEVAFAPGFDVPDAFIADVDRMTYSAYDDSHDASDSYSEDRSLAVRVRETGKPLLVIMGAGEQIIDHPQGAIDAYTEAVPTAFANLIRGVGHSPNVEEPVLTAKFVAGFAEERERLKQARSRHEMQDRLQNRDAVRQGA